VIDVKCVLYLVVDRYAIRVQVKIMSLVYAESDL
jgi:hypothetical protein